MKKTILIVLLSVFLLSALTVPAMSQSLDLGVEVDDWFKYELKVTRWESDDPFLPEGYFGPLSLADNETNFVLYTVTDITPVDGGNNVTFSITYDWKNGSVTEGSLIETVTTANTNLFEIGANMEEGDLVSDVWSFFGMMDYPARYLNASIDREYASGTRETNVCEYHIDIFGTPYDYMFQWDKATGIRVYYENSGDVPESTWSGAYNYTVVWELIETNVADWIVIPEFPTGTVMLLVFIVITVSIDIYRRKTLKH